MSADDYPPTSDSRSKGVAVTPLQGGRAGLAMLVTHII